MIKLSADRFSYLKNNLETKVFLFFIVFFFLIFQSLSYFSLWVETEIYPVHSSRYLFTEYMLDFLFSLKPIFYLSLYLSSLFSSLFSLLPMAGARFLFALNGLLILALMYFYIKKKTNKYNAILAVLVLASANVFLDRGFRVRSDLLCSSFSLITLLLTLNIKSKKDYWRFYITFLLLFSLLLISPKGIYWFLFTLCLMLYNLKHRMPSRWLIVKTVFAVSIIFYCLSFMFRDPFFIKSIYQSAKFYLSDLNEIYGFIVEHGWVKTLSYLSHIIHFIERNLFLTFLICVKGFFISYSIFISKKRQWDLSDVYFALLLLVLLFHPQQKLFFLCAVMPFILISFFTDWQWRQLIHHHYSLKFKTLLLAGAFLYSFFYISYFSFRIYMKKNNRPQKELIGKLNGFYKNTDPSIAIFDPTCILYERKTDCRYILDNNLWPKIFKSYLKQHNFDLILASRALDLFELIHYEALSFQYINIKNHIYYKALIVDLTNKRHFLGMDKSNDRLSLDDQAYLKKSVTAEWSDNRLSLNTKSLKKENKLTVSSKEGPIQAQKPDTANQPDLVKTVGLNKQIPPLQDEPTLAQEAQKKDLRQNDKPLTTEFLSGKKSLQFLLSLLKTKAPEKSRAYSYLFLNSQNQPIKKITNCQKTREKTLILLPGCPYSKEEFKDGIIPMETENLALFYLPFPLNLSEELSLRALFRYDIY